MRTLITGAGGFAGSHLADYLVGQGQEVTAVIGPRSSLANLQHILSCLEVRRADLCDDDATRELIRTARPERIYHLASISSKVDSTYEPKHVYDNILGATITLLCAWRDTGVEARLLYVSSAEVYGCVPRDALPLNEDHALRPVSPYAGAKVAAELAAAQFAESYRLPIVRVRPFNHTGPRQAPHFVCSDLAKQVAEINLGLHPPAILVGSLDVARDFSDVRDIVRGYQLLLEKGNPGHVYQLCSGRPVLISEILDTLLSFSRESVDVQVDSSRVRQQESKSTWGDSTKAMTAVGWKPDFTLPTTLWDLKEYWQRLLHS